MAIFPKKTLAVFSLTSCEGCQFELLSHYDSFNELLKFYEIKNFRLGQENNLPGPFNVALIEGSVEGKRQEDFVRAIRKHAGIVVAIGSCAHMGGIQSQRDRLPKKLLNRKPTKIVSDIIRVDYTIPGCPINQKEAVRCLLDLYWGKVFSLPDTAVCFECRLNENECHLKKDRPCLGPITRAGCNSICVNAGEACFGCRGPVEQANFQKIRQILETCLEKEEIENWLTIYGNYEEAHKKLIEGK